MWSPLASVIEAPGSLGRLITDHGWWARYVVPIAAATLTGVLIAIPSSHPALLVIAVCVWLIVWSFLWRAAFVGLFLFLPVAAVPGILLQQQGWPTLIKDGLFLLPGYVGLVLTLMKNRDFRWPLPGALTLLISGLVVVVAFQAFRLVPTLPLVALIGIRSWLLYLPLIVVPTVLLPSLVDVQRFFRLLVLVSLVPAVVGIIEFGLIVSGHFDLAYQWYGSLQSDATQGFAQVGVSDEIVVRRIPSTFPFVTQFVSYCLITTPLCLVTWMSDPERRWRFTAGVAVVAIIAAGLTSGSRTYLIWGPIEVGMVLILMNRGRVRLATML